MMNTRNGCLLAMITLLTACAEAGPANTGLGGDAAAQSAAIAPPITAPDEAPHPAQPPSYEVSIASAAADHNKALDRCARQPESVRTQCAQEANAAFADVEASLEPLRGNQE